MNDVATLLLELIAEELPPKSLRDMECAFAVALRQELAGNRFLSTSTVTTSFSTPRRIAVLLTNVRRRSLDTPLKQKVLPVSIAFDSNGNPTHALTKRLATLGLSSNSIAGLKRESDGKIESLYFVGVSEGVELDQGLQLAIDVAITYIPIAKSMRYSANGYWNDESFVRPLRAVVALHGSHVVNVEVLGRHSGRVSSGHRFLGRRDVSIANADAYEPTLEAEGKVVPSFDKRRTAVKVELLRQAQGDTPIAPDALLDEVTALVENPAVYAGTFDPAFLAVPQECLILTMQQNQKYFALTDQGGNMRPRFLVVSNLSTPEPAAIIAGNERVLRARLADAKFFFDQDRKQRLEARLPKLRNVVYHQKLGTQAERVERLRAIARLIAPALGADPALADRAALLAKADLVTDMVGEFPELQGTMGMYYARHDGETPDVWQAIEEHYRPRFAGDHPPRTPVGRTVAIADKLDLLVGMFEIQAIPTGDRDPFGLRRAALGICRTLVEYREGGDLNVPLSFAATHQVLLNDLGRRGTYVTVKSPCLIDGAAHQLPDSAWKAFAFTLERLRGWLREIGYDQRIVASILDSNPSKWDNILSRLDAVRAFEALPEAAALAAANKRIGNILKKSGAEAASSVDAARLAPGAEADLAAAFERLEPLVRSNLERGDFAAALKSLATTKPIVDRYFDEVMVMADDAAVRANRLALLARVAATMNRVADLSKL